MAHTAVEGSAARSDEQMEDSDVLLQYLQMFNSDCHQFKQYMASNGAVDWFGRTIRGHAKIHDYLRNEVCSEYQHVGFEKAQSCAAIEYKPTHFKTKTPPIGDIDYIQPKNKVSGITSLKLYADSDVEDDDVDMTLLGSPCRDRTPEKVQIAGLNSSATITPPVSTRKVEPSASETESEDDSDDLGMATMPKRLKRSHPSPFSYLRRHPSAVKRKLINDAGIRSLLDTNTDDEDDLAVGKDKTDVQYTPLAYIETTGVLRSQTGKTRKASVSSLPSTTNHYNDVRAGSWDRPVRIRISYRRRIQDQAIQFALIIYEHLDKSTAKAASSRRNLMLEFVQVSDTGNSDEEIEVVMENSQQQQELSHETMIEASLLSETPTTIPLMATPTKLSNTPPATPKRKPRLPQSLSSLKRFSAQNPGATSAATPSPKRSAARSLRL